jgi:hypothetical protein
MSGVVVPWGVIDPFEKIGEDEIPMRGTVVLVKEVEGKTTEAQ